VEANKVTDTAWQSIEEQIHMTDNYSEEEVLDHISSNAAVGETTTNYYPTSTSTNIMPAMYNFFPVDKATPLPQPNHQLKNKKQPLLLTTAKSNPTSLPIQVTTALLPKSPTSFHSSHQPQISTLHPIHANLWDLIDSQQLSSKPTTASTPAQSSVPVAWSAESLSTPTNMTSENLGRFENSTFSTTISSSSETLEETLVSKTLDSTSITERIVSTETITTPPTNSNPFTEIYSEPQMKTAITTSPHTTFTITPPQDISTLTTGKPVTSFQSGFLWFTKSPSKKNNQMKMTENAASVSGKATFVKNSFLSPLKISTRPKTVVNVQPTKADVPNSILFASTETADFDLHTNIRPNFSNSYDHSPGSLFLTRTEVDFNESSSTNSIRSPVLFEETGNDITSSPEYLGLSSHLMTSGDLM